MAVTTSRDVEIKIRIDTSGSDAVTKTLAANLDDVASATKKVYEEVGGFQKALQGVSVGVIGLNQALELVGKAYDFLAKPIERAVDAFIEQEEADVRLANSLKLVGRYTKESFEDFKNFSQQIQATTVTNEETAASLLATATAFGVTADKAKILVKASLDLSAANGKNLNKNFQALLKSLGGVSGELGELIPQVKGFTEAELKQGEALKYVSELFGGLADAEVKSYGGSLKQLANATGELFEEIGKLITGGLSLRDSTAELTKFMQGLTKAVANLEPYAARLSEAFSSVNWVELGKSILYVSAAFGALYVAMQGIAIVLASGGLSVAAISALGTAFAGLATGIGAAVAGFLPIVAGVTAAAATIDIVIRNFDKIPQLVGLATAAFLKFFAVVTEGFLKLARTGLESFRDLFGPVAKFIPGSLSLIESGLTKVSEALGVASQNVAYFDEVVAGAKEGVDFGFSGQVVEFFNKLINGTSKELKKAVDETGNFGSGLRDVVRATKEQLDLLRQINMENLSLGYDVINVGEDQIEILENQFALLEAQSKERIAILRLEGKLNRDIEDALERQIMLQRELTMAKIAEARINATSSGAQGAARGAGAALEGAGKIIDRFNSAFNINIGKFSSVFIRDLKVATAEIADAVITGAEILGDVVAGTATVLKGALSGEFVNKFASFIDEVGSLPESLVKAFEHLDQIIIKLINKFPAIIQGLVEKLPGLIAKFVEALPKLVDGLVKAFPKLVDALIDGVPKIAQALAREIPKLVQVIVDELPRLIEALPSMLEPLIQAIPRIFEIILKGLPDIIKKLFIAIGQIIGDIIKIIPDLLVSIFNNLPDIIGAIIEGLISAAGEIVAAFIEAFGDPENVNRIALAFLKMIPRLVVAIVKAFIKGVIYFVQAIGAAIGKIFQNLFGGKSVKLPENLEKLPEKIAEGTKKLVDNFAKETSKLFQVVDLREGLKGLDIADRIQDAIKIGVDDFIIKIKGIFKSLKEYVMQAWNWVIEHIWEPLKEYVMKAWNWVITNVYEPLAGVVQKAWQWVVDTVLTPLSNFVSAAWQWVVDKVLTPLYTYVTEAWAGVVAVFENLGTIVSDAWEKVVDVFNTLSEKVYAAFEPVFSFFNTIGEKIGGAFSTVTDMVEKFIGFFKMKWEDIPFLNAFNKLVSFFSKKWQDIPFLKAFNDLIETFKEKPEWLQKIQDFFKKFADIFQKIADVLEEVVGKIQDVADTVSGKGGGGYIGQATNSVKSGDITSTGTDGDARTPWSRGGVVYAAAGMPIPMGTDTVPAMLTPGEFVVNRRVAQQNLGFLDRLNKGQAQAGVTVGKIEINAKTFLDADQIRREVLPAIERSLLRKSQDGQRLIDPAGVRK